MMNAFRSTMAIAATLLIAVAGTVWGATTEEKCEAAKNQEAGKYAFCRAKAEAKAIKKGVAPDYSKCDTKLLDKWAKAEAKAIAKGTACIDAVTDTAIQSFVTGHTDAVAAALGGGTLPECGAGAFPASGQTTAYGAGSDGDVQAGAALSYTDNGDGTITDNNTGLMWEKKDDSGGIHDKDNTYTWTTGTNDMDGTISTVFLDALNDVGGGGANCFAGYCDWRIPNAKELQSIVDYEVFNPSVHPAFHQAGTCTGCADVTLASCSCTQSSSYWSATTSQGFPTFAWGVDFDFGFVVDDGKTNVGFVRAVRSGS